MAAVPHHVALGGLDAYTALTMLSVLGSAERAPSAMPNGVVVSLSPHVGGPFPGLCLYLWIVSVLVDCVYTRRLTWVEYGGGSCS